MSSQPPDEEAIFHIARKLEDAVDRDKYLDQVCCGDHALRERVESLLDVHAKEAEFLNSSPEAVPTVDHTPITETAGQRIGRFKLLQQIGEGGFGVVYMAEQTRPVRRKVALKIIKPGMDTHSVVARFEAERQALAMMDHPNIARIHDGGVTDSGRPYFVMELVRGVPITEYCDKNQLSTEQRLNLFATVCQAVQHAHQKGIIHRDLKPSNILVTLRDGQPVVKVIDFGVAKAINQQLTEKTLFTAFGQMVGTPAYMSPESAEMSELDIDTRSDVYSLGVLLYELLTGTTPLESDKLRAASFAEIQRMICEQEPPRPSTRLSTIGEQLTVIAKHRSVEPGKLLRSVKGELDWIVMKALEKERGRRYDSPLSLASDVARFLQSEAVQACPPSARYKVRKFIRRNRMLVSVGSLLTAALLLGIAGTTFGWIVAEGAQRTATAIAVRLATVADRLAATLYTSDVNSAFDAIEEGNMELARKLLHRQVPKTERDFRGFEWRLLVARYLHSQESQTLRFDSVVDSVTYGPGHDQLAIGLDDGSVYLINANDALTEPLPVPLVPANELSRMNSKSTPVAFSEDGELLVVGLSVTGNNKSPSGVVRVYQVRGLMELHQLAFGSAVEAVAVSQGGGTTKLACGLQDGRISVVDLESANPEPLTVKGHTQRINCITFSPDGNVLATASADKTAKFWDAEKLNELSTLDRHHSQVTGIAFSPDSQTLVTTSYLRVRFWSAENNGWQQVEESPYSAEFVTFSPNGKLVATAHYDSFIRIWDVATRELIGKLVHSATINSLAFSPDGKSLVSAGRDKTIRVWDMQRLDDQPVCKGNQHDFVGLDVSKSGLVAVSAENGIVRLWDPISGNKQDRKGHDDHVSAIAFSPNGDLLASASLDGTVRLWFEDGRSEEFEEHSGQVLSVAFSPDGRWLASCGENGELVVRDWQAHRSYPLYHESRCVLSSLAFSSDGWLASGGGVKRRIGEIKLWKVSAPNPVYVKTLPYRPDYIRCLAFSPDGRTLAIGDYTYSVTLRDVASPDSVPRTMGVGHSVSDLEFSPDGRTLATSSGVNIKFWHVETAEEMGTINTGEELEGVAFFADGRAMVTASEEGPVRIWRAATNVQVSKFLQEVGSSTP